MPTNPSWNYAGKLGGDFLRSLRSINALALLFNRQRTKLKTALLALDLVLNLIVSANPSFMPVGEEYDVVVRDTVESLMRDYDIDRYVTITSTRSKGGRTYLISVGANSSLSVRLMIHCGEGCDYFVDDRVSSARIGANTYFRLVMNALTIMGRLFNVGVPRVVLTHNPTIYGKVLPINEGEVIALSIWDLLRLTGVIVRREFTVNEISDIIDTAIHEYLHYVLDRKYMIPSTFMQMMKRVPSVFDDGIIHELITWTLTPRISRYVAECIKYGRASKIEDAELTIQYPIKRRHALTARRIINELLTSFNGDCG